MPKIHRQLLPPAAKNPFEKGFLDLPKLFNWDGLNIVFFFVSLRVTSWLKLGGGFWMPNSGCPYICQN